MPPCCGPSAAGAQLRVGLQADEGEWKVKQLQFEKDEAKDAMEEAQRSLERKNAAWDKMQDEMDILKSKAKKVDSAEVSERCP